MDIRSSFVDIVYPISVYRHVSLERCVVLFPASLLRVLRHLSPQFPVLIGTTGSYASSASFALCLRSPSTGATRFTFLLARKAEVFPKFLGNPSEHVPWARDSGGSSGPRSIGPADAAFRLANDVGFHNHKRFRSWFPRGPCSRCLRFAPIRSPG